MLHPQEAIHGARQAFVQEVPEALGQAGPRLWRDEGGPCRRSHGDDVSHLPDTQGSREEEVSLLQVHGGSDGKLWELRFDADGTYHWEAEGVTQEEKDAAMVDISRIKLRDQVVTHAPDRPCWKPWPNVMRNHISSMRRTRVRVRRSSTLERPRR